MAEPVASHACGGGTILAKRYLVAEELGRGAEGVVYLARDLRLGGRRVAVKTLHPDLPCRGKAIAYLAAEADVLCRINHPNIPTVLDHGPCERGYFIAFPLIKGRTLEQSIPSGGWTDLPRAVRLTARLARVLFFLWSEHGVLHLDVKPANILLPDGDPEAISLTDFGLAVIRRAGRCLIPHKGIVGTPAYMSPERARGDHSRVGHSADVYAVGVLLYRLSTGKLPFPAGYPQVFHDIQHEPAPPPSHSRPRIDAGLDEIVARSLAKSPTNRFGSGLELAQELEKWIDGEQRGR